MASLLKESIDMKKNGRKLVFINQSILSIARPAYVNDSLRYIKKYFINKSIIPG
jgi:hypothetical protein